MPRSSVAEAYFIVAMMIMILVFAFAASYFFVRQYRREMREKRERAAKSESGKAQQPATTTRDENPVAEQDFNAASKSS